MEVVGAAASVLTLIETAAVIGGAAFKLHHDLQDTPQEIARIAERILVARSLLEAHLQFHSAQVTTTEHGETKIIDDHSLASLELSLQRAKGCLKQLDRAIAPHSQKPTKSQGLRWIFKERGPVLKLIQYLQNIESDLSKIMLIAS